MIDPENIQHVVPVNDGYDHITECVYPINGEPYCECKCLPKYKKVEPNGLVIIHSSLDGREGLEWANEILNQ